MKNPSHFKIQQQGVALVLVLAMLVLMSALLVAFVTSAGTENTAAKTFAQGLDARQAAETATNVVIAQLREATKRDGIDATWASQPGAIRTFGRSKSDNIVYKLYSAEKLQEPEGSYDPQADSGIASGSLSTLPESYVDINEPVMVPVPGDDRDKVEPRYPIVSPYPSYEFDGKKFKLSSTTAGKGAVEGFTCNAIDDPSGRKDINNDTVKLLPMPVRWMYVLKDGRVSGVNTDGKIEHATKDNPPVSRIAFWTDDDSSRLNINTASEGTYWDTPHVSTLQDSGAVNGLQPATGNGSLNFAVAQPAKAEYQRFPGHPASTCLSPALRWLFRDGPFPYPPKANDPDLQFKEEIYRMAPKVMGGDDSSLAGTRNVKDRTSQQSITSTKYEKTAVTRSWDHDRLYASVDEYFFRPDRTGRDVAPNAKFNDFGRYTGDVANRYFTPENLEKLRFFLTAHSRAPELNTFGKPRISMWPIHEELPKRTAFDDLSAFCATIPATTSSQQGKPYYVIRRNPNSAVDDFSILSNQRLYKYMQDLTKRPLPFLSQSFLGKYNAANRDQILTEIFDYIRCTNLVDTGVPKKGAAPLPRKMPDYDDQNTPAETEFPYAYTRYYWTQGSHTAEQSKPAYGSGQVVPLKIDKRFNPESNIDTKGFGRFATLAEVAILFYKQASTGTPPKTIMKAVILNDMFVVSQGFPGISERYSIRVRIPNPSEDFLVWDNPNQQGDPIRLNFPVDALNSVDCDSYNAPIGRVMLPFRGIANQFLVQSDSNAQFSTTPKSFGDSPANSPDRTKYPFFSRGDVAISGQQFSFKGGKMEITIYDRPANKPGRPTGLSVDDETQVVQRFQIDFPDVKGPLPVPKSPQPFSSRLSMGINGDRNSNLGFSDTGGGRAWIANDLGTNPTPDVVRSVEIAGVTAGDQRISAANLNVPNTFFSKREDDSKKFDSAAYLVHGLRLSRGAPYHGASQDGNLVTGASWRKQTPYGSDNNPKPPRVPWSASKGKVGVVKANGTLGDWDRGLSKNMAGAFINKADEGNTNFEGTTGNLAIPYFLGYGGFSEAGGSNFSPNRLMPSAVMLGGLPTHVGVDGPGGGQGTVRPWQTLLFRPENKKGEHEGVRDPSDHYLLDLFEMPIVEPYAISEPLSTMGKVNLNYKIAPFGYVKIGNAAYIERRTALYGLFKAVKLLLVKNNVLGGGHWENPLQVSDKLRFDLDRKKTVDEMDKWLEEHNQSMFRTASEICDVQLYPEGMNVSNWGSFWDQYPLTGDNGRERPYAHIYPRATTKSNVFTVYVRAQSIKKSTKSDPEIFDEEKDRVTGEYRGSSTIERFLDPNDPAIADYDPLKSEEGLDKYYRFRVLNTKRFNP